jgi:hypothetical protein
MIKVATLVVDVTPEYPIHILGHSMRKEKSKGAHDAIEFIIMSLIVDEKRFLFITVDLLGVDYEFTGTVRKAISNQVKIDEDSIVISATHTHSAPLINDRDSTKQYDEKYRQFIIDKLIHSSLSLIGKEESVKKVICKCGKSEGFYGNRDIKDGYGDQNIYVVNFYNNHEEVITSFVNIACHSTVLSPVEYQLSADLLGAIRRELAKILKITPLVTNGAAGDMSNRHYRQANDFNELSRVSKGIAMQVQNFNKEMELELEEPTIDSFIFTEETEVNQEEVSQKLNEMKEKLALSKTFEERKYLYSEIQDYEEQLKQKKFILNFETSIIDMKDLQLVVLSCEISASLGKKIRHNSKAKLCIILGYSNGQTTYMVEKEMFEKGHGGIVTKLKKGVAEEYINEILARIK